MQPVRSEPAAAPVDADRAEAAAIGRDPRAAALAAWEAMKLDRLIEQIGSAPAAPSLLSAVGDKAAPSLTAGSEAGQEERTASALGKHYAEF